MRLSKEVFDRFMGAYHAQYGKVNPELMALWWEKCSHLREEIFVTCMKELLGNSTKFGYNQVLRSAMDRDRYAEKIATLRPAKGIASSRVPGWARETMAVEDGFRAGRVPWETMSEKIHELQAHIWHVLWPGTDQTMGQVWADRFVDLGRKKSEGRYEPKPFKAPLRNEIPIKPKPVPKEAKHGPPF